MQFDFQAAINALNAGLPFGDSFAFNLARTKNVPSEYLFNTILPQEEHASYNVSGGSMRIFPTMAQLTPMDTPAKPIGAMESNFFNENTAKWGGTMHFPEERLRELQSWYANMAAVGVTSGSSAGQILEASAKRITDTLLGFSDVLLKSQWDNLEWLRGQALTTGALSLTNSGLALTVDYDVPAANKITRTGGANSYYGTTSKFWTDIRFLYTKLSSFKIIMNSATYYSIVDNSVNAVRVEDNFGIVRSIVKVVGTTEVNSSDKRDRVQIYLYDKSGSSITPKGTMKAVPFLPNGKVIVIGEQEPDGFELTMGSTDNPDNRLRLGHTHVAPTVEGGRPGIWSRIFTPELKPYQLLGETFVNALPVIVNPNKLIILTTDMP